VLAAPLAPLDAESHEWAEPCQLPSVTAGSELLRDTQVYTLGESTALASATALSATDECTQCNFAAPVVAPTWSISAGGIWLHRSRPESAAIATPPTGTPGVTINGTDFGFDWGAGVDVGLMHRGKRGYIWEARYFNSNDADAAYNIPNITTFRIAGIGVTILGGGSLNSTYSTKLDSSELNLHKMLNDRVTIFSGFRWIELHDTLRVNMATPATFTRWDENNHMYGGQVGTNWALLDPNSAFRLNLSGKAGAYSNEACNRFTSTIVSGNHQEDSEIAFVGESSLTATYFFTEHLALRGGYQVMWLDNVALASDAAAATRQIAGGTSSPVITDGRLFYNGATAAVEFVW
jgi:hypothetical protein